MSPRNNFTVGAKRFLCAEHAENEIWKAEEACKTNKVLTQLDLLKCWKETRVV